MMDLPLQTLLLSVFGYLLGSLTFSVWIVRLTRGIDLRLSGSGHAGATNTMRQAGWGIAILVLVLDFAKGFLPTWLAVAAGLPDLAIALVAAFTVIGHCWPIFGGFRGGMGLATAAGAMLAVSWLGVFIVLGVLVSLVLTIRHTARATIVGTVVAPVVMWLLGQRGPEFWLLVFVGVVVAIRFARDWNREYKELWLDRG